MSQLSKAAAWLGKTMARHNSSGSETTRKVYFLHGAHKIEISATLGESEVEVTDTDGQLTLVQTRDYLVNAAALNVDGKRFEPSADGRILEELTTDGVTESWLHDVIKLPGKGTYQWCDQHRVRMRIFAERTATRTTAAS